MNNTFGKLPTGKMKIFLVCFCLIGGGLSLFFVYDALFNDKKKSPSYSVEPIHVPKYYDRSGEEFRSKGYSIDEDLITQILHFERYMDSLRGSPSGKILYDSIVSIRPGLMDSVALLKMMYQEERTNQ